ncbi:phosphatidylglycerophosphatase A family protein [Hahella sp. NBU794]|uniref:phosphatidylglycerophosphatase A family protein n=1 Tax=Hahella sp. NBU794 TaxID=3422590 RepID=UPI003D6FCC8C
MTLTTRAESSFTPSVIATLKSPTHLLAAGLGSGLAPWAPGTFGSALAVLIYMASLAHLGPWLQLSVIFVSSILGVYLCGRTASDWGVHDHKAIVWDEFVGQWIALFLLPWNSVFILLAFVYFRLFDIWKPWPIRWCDRHIHGGKGIMLDDLLAGVMALAATQLTIYCAALF